MLGASKDIFSVCTDVIPLDFFAKIDFFADYASSCSQKCKKIGVQFFRGI